MVYHQESKVSAVEVMDFKNPKEISTGLIYMELVLEKSWIIF